MPSVPKDVDKLLKNTDIFFRFLPIKKIYIVGPSGVAEKMLSKNDSRLIFVNENEFVDVPRIKELYASRTDEDQWRAGWYVQQFIKMQFARFTDEEYYLIWDSDTIPMKPVAFFDEASGKPIMRRRFTMWQTLDPYLAVLSKVLPDIKNNVRDTSFVLEHMLIKTEYMRELLDKMESNADIAGSNFQEKIINSVEKDNLMYGFSEFQTYGIFITEAHPDSYYFTDNWRNLRGIQVFSSDAQSLSEEQIKWFASRYNVVSIEKWQKPTKLSRCVESKLFRALFPPTLLEFLASPRLIITRPVKKIIPNKYWWYLHEKFPSKTIKLTNPS